MKKLFKLLCIILCLSLIVSVAVSCDSNEPVASEGSTNATSATENNETSTSAEELSSTDEETVLKEESSTDEITSEEESYSTDEASSIEEATSTEESTSAGVETEETAESVESEEETDPVEYETREDVVSFVDYVSESSRAATSLVSGGDLGVSFKVPNGQLKELYITIGNDRTYLNCSVDISIYAFDGDYDSSVANEPIRTEHVTQIMKTHTLFFEEGEIGAGEYLVVVGYHEVNAGEGSQLYTSALKDNFWNGKTLPEEYEQYNIRAYTDGEPDKRNIICGGFLIEHDAPKYEEVEEVPSYGRDPVNSVKVILLSGQSNAAGVSLTGFLRRNVGDEEYKKYVLGYSNVKILYKNGSTSNGISYSNVVNEFVNVGAGQGVTASNFGPELGLADYLSRTYPGETFYIIKCGVGGAGMDKHFNVNDPDKDQCLEDFEALVDDGLAMLEEQGLVPKIVGFLWMQGESEATTHKSAYDYYDQLKALVERIRSDYEDYASAKGIAFIDASISDTGFWASSFLLNARKQAFSRESSLNHFIDTEAAGLTALYENNDLAHYDSMSMFKLGELFGVKVSEAIYGGLW